MARILELHLEESLESRHRGVQRWIDDIYGNILPIRRHSGQWELSATASPLATELFLASLHRRRFEHKLSSPIQPEDELVFRVYCADHSFTTLKTRIDEKAAEIKLMAAKKLNLQDKELILVHVKSNGERIIFNDSEFSVSTNLSVNGRIFVCPLDHIDAISPLPEQDPFQEVYQGLVGSTPNSNNPQLQIAIDSQQTGGGSMSSDPTQQLNNNQLADQQQQQQVINSHLLNSTPTNYADIKTQMSLSVGRLEEFSSRDIAYCLTQLAWSLLKNVHEFELVYCVLGRHNFKQVTANLNVFLRHFNEIQYWVVTQICLTTSLSKRVQILRKFIKIAAHCKELQNLNAFFAIIMGLSNMAVARLTQTWEKLPSKLKRTFSQFESQIDPSRNHRRYRIFISKMEPPIIPFMPLLIKDMTFAHEGNKTYLENGLINFEKMQMVAQTLRTIRYCKSRPMKLDQSVCKFKGSIRSIELFFRDLKIIDNQRTLTQMSHQLEHRKT